MISCKKFGSEKRVKDGRVRGRQRYSCKECGCNFIEGDRRITEKIGARKAMCMMLYATGKISINKIAKTFGMCWSLIYRWTNESAEKLSNYEIKNDVERIEFDEMWHFLYKKRKLWLIKSFDREKNEMIAWVTGFRSAKNF